MQKRALIIANQHYDDARLAELPSAAADAEQLAAVLADKAIGEFDVETLIDQGRAEACRHIEVFFRKAGRDDLLLLHLSCHGKKDMRGRLSFAAADTNLDFPSSSGVSSGLVTDLMEESRSKRIILMLDCCYSGAFTRGLRARGEVPEIDVAELFSGRGRVVITSSNSLQYSYEGEMHSRREADPAVFTAAVIRGLRDGDADLDGDGYVSVSELYDFVHDQVTQIRPDQTPTLSVNGVEGSIYLARNPRAVRGEAAGLSPQVWRAISHGQVWERQGALHEIEQLLGSVFEERRFDAKQALSILIGDDNWSVAKRAMEIWQDRGFGDLPTNRTPRPRGTKHRLVRSIGIDLGTTNSSVAYFDGTDVRLIPNAEGSVITPSVVAFTASGDVLVGAAAKRQAVTNHDLTVQEVKLKLGTDWTMRRGDVTYSAEEIAALLLRKLRKDAEIFLDQDAADAVLTVPAYFNHIQRRALVEAAQIAGINVLRTLNEPTAAALVYDAYRNGEDQTILVFDLGGGTFDVSLLEIGEGVCEVKATSGDQNLGGRDWDKCIVDHLVREFHNLHQVDLNSDPVAMQRLQEAAEAAKIDLSSAESTTISLPYISFAGQPLDLDTHLTRTRFEELSLEKLNRCETPIQQAIKDSGISVDDINLVVLVGGSTRMPSVDNLVHRLTKGKRAYRGLIPDGVVKGATLQAAVLRGELKDYLLLDVTSMSLGIETQSGIFTRIIERNTTIPTKRSEVFTTARDNQPSIAIHIYQGERELVGFDKKLGAFLLPEIPPAPRGVPQIEITFDIDANGVVSVSAKDLGTNREVGIIVNRTSPEQDDFDRDLLPIPQESSLEIKDLIEKLTSEN